jgi:hypothetical protein
MNTANGIVLDWLAMAEHRSMPFHSDSGRFQAFFRTFSARNGKLDVGFCQIRYPSRRTMHPDSPDSVMQPARSMRWLEAMQLALRRYFYLAGSLLITVIVVYGFSHTIDHSLLHPEKPPPLILYVHAAMFSTWLLLLVVQSSLVRVQQVRLHRTLGYAGLALGAAMPVVAIATRVTVLHAASRAAAVGDDEIAFTTVTLNDMLCFGTAFALAMLWRKKPEHHRRLIYIASCCLTVAAFARMPESLVVPPWWYAYADALIVLGMLRDLIAERRIHRVYQIGLPLLMICQASAMALFLIAPPGWVATLRWLLM